MERKKERDFRKLKNGQSVLSVISFVISYICFSIVLGVIILVFFLYMQNTKLKEESDNVNYMARLYQKSLQNGDSGVQELLEESDRDYIVRTPMGKILAQRGENTSSNRRLLFSGADEEILYNIYADNSSLKYFDNENGVDLNGLLKAYSIDIKATTDDDEEGVVVESVDIPYWIAVRLDDGSDFLGKCILRIEKQDVVVIATFLGAMVVLLIVIFVGLIGGIIRSQKYQQELTSFFQTDEITGGNNWMAFLMKGDSILDKGSKVGKRYAVLHLVIVKYRNYCMCHSLEEGETILWNISRILEAHLKNRNSGKKNFRKKIKETRELCAHVSSSSFALLLEYTEEDNLKHRINAMMEDMQKANEDHVFHYQVGVALLDSTVWKEKKNEQKKNKKQENKEEQLEHYYNNACTARATLESNDDSGIAFFNQSLVDEQIWINKVQENQENALKQEAFVVYYQPKYSPIDGKLSGAEALIRWQWPKEGLVSPGRFIPIFEKNGFITEIDHYMIRHVARDQKAWLDAGLPCVPVSVNVSRAHFVEEDLAEQIRDMVDEAGTPHHLIEIELTESAFFDDKNALITTINRLKAYGFKVSMDDFGSGYSSLNSLKDMALDVLKLDAEFFRGDADRERKEIVVSEAIKLARSLNMQTVAEGVEDKDQVEFLARQGCDMIQGYYFAEPMPGMDYEKRIREVYHKVE